MRRLRDMSVGRRQTAAFAVMGLLAVVVMLGATVSSASQASSGRALAADTRAVAAVLQIKFMASDVNGWQTAYALDATQAAPGTPISEVADGSGQRSTFTESAAAFRVSLAEVRGMSQLRAYAPEIRRIASTFERFMDLDERIVSLLRSGTADAQKQAVALVLGPELKNLASMTSAAERIEVGVQRDAGQRSAGADRAAQRVGTAMIISMVLFVLLGALLALVITRSMTRPLRRTVSLLREVAGGDLRGRVVEPGGDELGQMGVALNETLVQMSETVDGIAEGSATLSAASEELSAVSQQMSAAAEETAARAGSVSVAADQVSHNVQSVSAGTEELGTTVTEIARNTTEAAQVAGEAVRVAQQANATVLRLGASSAEIGEVVKVITSIAEQTNMLALNATIEAARAGDVGKGFAVVAGEVKDLARKTATSSEEIGRKIATIQQDTSAAVDAITQITDIVQRVNDIQTVIAAAVEEQAVTTSEIGRSVTEAADGTGDIARSITGVAETARGTTQGATETHRAAEELARLSTDLLGLVRRFTIEGRASALGVPPR